MKVLGTWKRARSGQANWAKWVRPLAMILPLFAITVFLSACTFEGQTMTIDPSKSPENRELWSLYSLVFWLAVAVFIVVEAMLFYAVIRYRSRPGQPLPRQIHGNNRLEITWTIIPALLLIIIAVPTVAGHHQRGRPRPGRCAAGARDRASVSGGRSVIPTRPTRRTAIKIWSPPMKSMCRSGARSISR